MVKGCRDYAMLPLIATYGLRRSEVSSLNIDDIQWRARIISVPRPEVGTPLVVPLTDEVATNARSAVANLVGNGVIDDLPALHWAIAKLLSGCGTAR
jgi:integrase